METLTLGKMAGLLKRKFKVIMTFALIGFLAGVLYALIAYKPNYESTAKLLIKDTDQTAFVTEFGDSSKMTSLASNSNPLLTQMQVLQSEGFARQVWQNVSQKYNLIGDEKPGAKMIQNAVSIKNPVGTDIITITAKWSDPEIAREVAKEYAKVYITSNADIAKQGVLESKQVIDKQLAEAEINLQEVRNRIKEFKQNTSTVDLKVESENIVNQIANLESKYDDVRSLAFSEADKVNSLSKNLGMDWHQAIKSVALGSNPNYIEIQNKLTDLEQEQAALATKYTVYHPSKISIDAKVNNLKDQMEQQIKSTIGSAVENNNIVIHDPVRTGMMESLINSEASYRGLQAQAGALRRAISQLKARKSEIPQQQLAFDNAMQDEANWASIVNTLKAKQIEADIRMSEIANNISLVDAPIVPMYCAFPNRVQIVMLFSLFAVFLCIAGIMITAVAKNVYDDVEQMERDLHSTVLGTVPWLEQEDYDDPGILFAIDESASFYSLAYQKIVSGLRIKGYNSDTNALAFTSSEFSKFRSTIIMNTAYGLSKTGQSVVVVDADFRTPSISSEFGLKISEKFNLAELLAEISREKRSSGSFNWEKLNYFVQELPKTEKLYIIPNAGNVPDPCEYLHSASFGQLIQELKKRYDWVLLDVPPALAVPDALTVGSSVDGMVLVTGLDADRSVLRKIYKQFKSYGVPIFGIVARELQTKEAASSNEYIRQMISRMMPQNEALLAEE